MSNYMKETKKKITTLQFSIGNGKGKNVKALLMSSFEEMPDEDCYEFYLKRIKNILTKRNKIN